MCIYHAIFFVCSGQAFKRVYECDLPKSCLPHLRTLEYRTEECRICDIGRAVTADLYPRRYPTTSSVHAWVPVYFPPWGPGAATGHNYEHGWAPGYYMTPVSPNNNKHYWRNMPQAFCHGVQHDAYLPYVYRQYAIRTSYRQYGRYSSSAKAARNEGQKEHETKLSVGEDGFVLVNPPLSFPGTPRHQRLSPAASEFRPQSHDDDDTVFLEPRCHSCPPSLFSGHLPASLESYLEANG